MERIPTTLRNPRAVSVQFRYAFVTDDDGLKVIDISEPTKPRLVPGAFVPLQNAQRFYVARTYAYVANGSEGLAIIDIENPEKPKLLEMFNCRRRAQRHSLRANRFRERVDVRTRRGWEKWAARAANDFAGERPRPHGIQPAPES